MVKKSYTCLRCNKIFNNKSYFRKHLERKIPCEIININLDISKLEIENLLEILKGDDYEIYYNNVLTKCIKCKNCNKYYTTNSNMLRHLKTCKKVNIIQNQQQISNIYNIVNNNIINNYINIENINALGYEDKTLIDYDKLEFVNKEEYDNYSLNDKSNNHVHNLKSILDDIYKNPVNQNFKLVNKKEQKYKVKTSENIIESKHIIELHNIINDILVNIYDEYLNDNKEKLQHYIDHLQEHYIQLQKYKENKYDKTAREYKIINDKVQKCLKRAIVWIAEDNKKNNILLN